MKCITCSCTDSSLLKLQTFVDNKALKEIPFILPDFVIETQGPVYVCTICQEQISAFYKLKKRSLENCAHLNFYKNILKETIDSKFNELKITIDINKVTVKKEQDIEFETIDSCKELIPSKDEVQFSEKDPLSLTSNGENKKYPRADKNRFKCSHCEATFAYRSYLKAHNRVHTGERPFECSTCHKTYNQISGLNRHILTHTGERPHKCDVCYKTFNRKSCLIIHKQGHDNDRPFPCNECTKSFKQICDLKMHMRIHKGEKDHQCHLCEYKATQAGTLKTHLRTHTGEKPYTCELCPKSFTQSSSLQLHKRRVHNSNGDSN